MAIQLPADIEARIGQKVARGDFPDAGEVVREAMRLLDEQERQINDLLAKLRSGLDQLDRGEGVAFTAELVDQLRRETPATASAVEKAPTPMSSPRRAVILSPDARADLTDILLYSWQQWGEDQRDRSGVMGDG